MARFSPPPKKPHFTTAEMEGATVSFVRKAAYWKSKLRGCLRVSSSSGVSSRMNPQKNGPLQKGSSPGFKSTCGFFRYSLEALTFSMTLFIVFPFVFATISFAATPTQIRNAVDSRLTTLWGFIQTHQANYLAANGKYWQGLHLLPTVPADGAVVAIDRTQHPTDQVASWSAAAFDKIPATIEMQLEVFTHNGPDGQGYTGIATVTISGQTWQRAQGFGPGSFTFAWRQVVAAP